MSASWVPSTNRACQHLVRARASEAAVPNLLELLLSHRIAVQSQLDEITRSLAAIDFTIATYQGKALPGQ